MRRSLVVAIAGTALLVACSEQSPVELAEVPQPEFAISDGASGGNEHFYFLPPMVKSPSYSGTFDPTLSPVVVIKQGETVLGELEAVLDENNEQYHANWHTVEYGLSTDLMYRLSVQVDGYEVGFADIDMVENGSGLRHVQTDDYIGLVDGRTLPVKFRLEDGWEPEPAGASVVAGNSSACATDVDGNGFCWGSYYSGIEQVGVGIDWRVVQARAGWANPTCGISSDNRAYCWSGPNSRSPWPQMPTLASAELEVTHVAGLSPITAFVGADWYPLMAAADGEKFLSISSADWNFCGVTLSGATLCAGWDNWGQQGRGGTVTDDFMPLGEVVGGLEWIEVWAGTNHTCGVDSQGASYCFGADYYGQVGNGDPWIQGCWTPYGYQTSSRLRSRLPEASRGKKSAPVGTIRVGCLTLTNFTAGVRFLDSESPVTFPSK